MQTQKTPAIISNYTPGAQNYLQKKAPALMAKGGMGIIESESMNIVAKFYSKNGVNIEEMPKIRITYDLGGQNNQIGSIIVGNDMVAELAKPPQLLTTKDLGLDFFKVYIDALLDNVESKLTALALTSRLIYGFSYLLFDNLTEVGKQNQESMIELVRVFLKLGVSTQKADEMIAEVCNGGNSILESYKKLYGSNFASDFEEYFYLNLDVDWVDNINKGYALFLCRDAASNFYTENIRQLIKSEKEPLKGVAYSIAFDMQEGAFSDFIRYVHRTLGDGPWCFSKQTLAANFDEIVNPNSYTLRMIREVPDLALNARKN